MVSRSGKRGCQPSTSRAVGGGIERRRVAGAARRRLPATGRPTTRDTVSITARTECGAPVPMLQAHDAAPLERARA